MLGKKRVIVSSVNKESLKSLSRRIHTPCLGVSVKKWCKVDENSEEDVLLLSNSRIANSKWRLREICLSHCSWESEKDVVELYVCHADCHTQRSASWRNCRQSFFRVSFRQQKKKKKEKRAKEKNTSASNLVNSGLRRPVCERHRGCRGMNGRTRRGDEKRDGKQLKIHQIRGREKWGEKRGKSGGSFWSLIFTPRCDPLCLLLFITLSIYSLESL